MNDLTRVYKDIKTPDLEGRIKSCINIGDSHWRRNETENATQNYMFALLAYIKNESENDDTTHYETILERFRQINDSGGLFSYISLDKMAQAFEEDGLKKEAALTYMISAGLQTLGGRFGRMPWNITEDSQKSINLYKNDRVISEATKVAELMEEKGMYWQAGELWTDLDQLDKVFNCIKKSKEHKHDINEYLKEHKDVEAYLQNHKKEKKLRKLLN